MIPEQRTVLTNNGGWLFSRWHGGEMAGLLLPLNVLAVLPVLDAFRVIGNPRSGISFLLYRRLDRDEARLAVNHN